MKKILVALVVGAFLVGAGALVDPGSVAAAGDVTIFNLPHAG